MARSMQGLDTREKFYLEYGVWEAADGLRRERRSGRGTSNRSCLPAFRLSECGCVLRARVYIRARDPPSRGGGRVLRTSWTDGFLVVRLGPTRRGAMPSYIFATSLPYLGPEALPLGNHMKIQPAVNTEYGVLHTARGERSEVAASGRSGGHLVCTPVWFFSKLSHIRPKTLLCSVMKSAEYGIAFNKNPTGCKLNARDCAYVRSKPCEHKKFFTPRSWLPYMNRKPALVPWVPGCTAGPGSWKETHRGFLQSGSLPLPGPGPECHAPLFQTNSFLPFLAL